jgi:hypothetical protein
VRGKSLKFLFVLPVLVLALLAAGCGGDDAEAPAPTRAATTPSPTPTPTATASGAACGEDFDAEPSKQPADNVVEVPGYFHIYRYENGPRKTERWYAVLDGTPQDLSFRRDDAMNFLVQNSGYAPVSNAYEEGVRASAKLQSPEREVDLLVTVPCAGKLRVRYTVGRH